MNAFRCRPAVWADGSGGRASGTDHLSFDAVGLPGFQFIQDPLDYDTVTHHSDLDTYDHAVGGFDAGVGCDRNGSL
jgi:hypothetical protein